MEINSIKRMEHCNMIATINDSSFKTILNQSMALVLFSASWCGPCQKVKLMLEKFSQETTCKIYIFDIDGATTPILQSIKSVPTVVLYKNGFETFRHFGAGISLNKLKEITSST